MARRYRRRFRMRRLLRRLRRNAGGVLAVAAGLVLAVAVHASTASNDASTPAGSTAQTLTTGATSTGANVTLGQQMAAARGWTGGQWSCLDWLWTRESGWNAYAANPTSDARGIPQNINGWSAYGPGDARSQITWGLDYIAGRYGTPCAAWSHETADSWY